MPDRLTIALTGATGFVGGHVLTRLLGADHQVRALTRRAQPTHAGVTWVEGALDRPSSLTDLVAGADRVVHVAGVTSAPDLANFTTGNVDGTRAMLAATQAAGVDGFVHVSSLAATQPQLSAYGRSKAAAEALVEASPLRWTIVRPPAVFGPGDMEFLDIFRLARRGIVPLPPPGRLSVIAVDDLAALLVALAAQPGKGAIYEADDGTGGWTHAGFARAIGAAIGRRVRPVSLPGPLLAAAAWLDTRLRGKDAKLTPDRVAYFRHPDWTIDPSRRPPPALWQPAQTTERALADTATWYRAQGLL